MHSIDDDRASVSVSTPTPMSDAAQSANAEHPTAAQLEAAKKGFDHLFSNEIKEAQDAFASGDSPFHLLGQGVCAFLEAALGMEVGSHSLKVTRSSHAVFRQA